MRGLFLVAAALLFAAQVRADPIAPPAGSWTQTIATGASTSRSLGDRAAQVLNIKDGTGATPGAKGDGQCTNGGQCVLASTTTMAQNSNALSTGSALFAPADVGKVIIIGHAGATPTTGSVIASPVTAPGNGYQTLPSCAIAGGSGTNALCFPMGKIVSATLAGGGTGCVFTGTQVFTIASGIGRWATITGTVTGGSLTGTLTVVDGGYFTSLPLLNGVFASGGGGCTTYPTVNLSIGINTIVESAFGAGYPMDGTTATTLTGGSPAVAATLGTTTVYAPIPPLVTTIASYTNPTHIVTTAQAQTAVSGSTPIFWATDDFASIQAVLTAANAQQKNVYIPSGDFYSGSALDPGPGNISIRGDGMFASRLWYNGFASPLLQNQHGTPTSVKGSLQFEDFGIRGLLDFGEVGNGQGNDAIILLNYATLDFNSIHCSYAPNGCSAMESIRNFSATNTLMEYLDGGAWRCRSCFNGAFTGNHFYHDDDDSIDWHQAPYIQSAGTIRQGLTVVGNTFEDAVPIHSLGSRVTTIQGNTCDRCKLYFASVDHSTSEGVNQIFSIDISGNVITNMLGRAPFNGSGNQIAQSVISINAIAPQAGVNDPNFIPGTVFRMSSSQAIIVPPYAYYNNSMVNNTDPTVYPVPPASSISVHDNKIMRTLLPVEHYSAWGEGTPASELLGLGIDPPVSDIALRSIAGIAVTFNGIGVNVHDNAISSVQRGITLSGTPNIGPAMSEVELHDNFIYDATEYGIFGINLGTENRISISGGRIVSDPYRISPGRSGAFGAWSASYSDNACINMSSGAFVRVSNVAFEECYQIEAGSATNWQNTDNWVYGTFNTVGSWSSVNLGIGAPPFGGAGFHLIETVAGATNTGAYGAGAANHYLENLTVPTAGFHAQGEFIRSQDPASCSCLGWSMKSSGLGWVSGTDYTITPNQ